MKTEHDNLSEPVHCRLTPKLKKQIDAAAKRYKWTRSYTMFQILRNYFFKGR